MSVPDALIGRVLLVAITAAFAYVTLWLFAVPFVEQNHAVLALFPPSYDYIFLPVCLAGTAAAALALALVGALYVAEGVGKPVPPLRLRVLPPHSASR